MYETEEQLVARAIAIASSGTGSDLPIAAVVFDNKGCEIAAARNLSLEMNDITAHAEIIAIRAVGTLATTPSFRELTLAVTLEPCPMCAWAIRIARFGKVLFGAYNPHYGAAGSAFDLLRDGRYGVAVDVRGGILEEECAGLLGAAFTNLRHNNGR